MYIRLLSVLACVLCCSTSFAEEPVEIPLSDIWALDMPGTKDVRELDPRKIPTDKTLISKIYEPLMRSIEKRIEADRCFLVSGEGKEALLNAAKVLAEGESPAKTLPTDTNVTLVFYSQPAPGYVHIDSVTRLESRVIVKYRVVIHKTLEATAHFALIPLGAFQPGRVTVETDEQPSDTAYGNHDLTEKAVCKSCMFLFQDEGTEK